MVKKTTLALAAAMTLGLTSIAVAQGFSVGIGPGGVGVGIGVAPYGAYDGYYDGYYGNGPVYGGGVVVGPSYYSAPGTVYVEPDYNTGYASSWSRNRNQRYSDRPGNQ